MIDVLDEPQLRRNPGLTAADILEGTGNIMVQRTQGGGGSPVLRGFEANKILLVVDGVAELAPGEGLGTLLERADGALYAAKQAGRNRVERADRTGKR